MGRAFTHYHEDPEGVVEENYRGGHEHGEADKSVELGRDQSDSYNRFFVGPTIVDVVVQMAPGIETAN